MGTEELSYDLFLAEQMLEQAELEMFIDECILIGEGTNTLSNVDVIYESFVDKIKESCKKFLQAIANMWHKFLESMNTLLKTDKAYLEKYKDIILNKTHVECDYSMYNYEKGNGIKTLLNSPVPVLNINSMDTDLATDESFIQKNFSSLTQGAKSPYVISDLAKAKFRGGSQEVTIKSTHLNMTDMYNYCYGYKKLEELIGKDITAIQKSATDILLKVDKMVRDGQIKKESFGFESSSYYSMVTESFVNEATPTRVETKKPESNTTTPDNNNGTTDEDKNKETPNSPQQNKPEQAYQKSTGETDDNINTEKAAKELTEKANRYLKICGDFLGAKQSVSEEIYKSYMSIIRAHVRDHVGKKDKLTTKGKDVATDYTSKEKEVKDKLESKNVNSDVVDSVISIMKSSDNKNTDVLIKWIEDNDEATVKDITSAKAKEITSADQNSEDKPKEKKSAASHVMDIFKPKPKKK